MKLHLFYLRTHQARGQAPPQAREKLLRAGWHRLHPERPFPAAGLARTAQGRPWLPGEAFCFSLSHADNLSVLACALAGRLGVDLAHASEAALARQLDASFFSPAEQQALARQQFTPLQLWTRKEALLKAAGTGLLLAPAQAVVNEATCYFRGHHYLLHSVPLLGEYELALAAAASQGPLEALDWTEVPGATRHYPARTQALGTSESPVAATARTATDGAAGAQSGRWQT